MLCFSLSSGSFNAAKMSKTLAIDIGLTYLAWSLMTRDSDGDIEDIIFDISKFPTQKGAESIVINRCSAIVSFITSMHQEHHLTHIIVEKQVITNVAAMSMMYSIVTTAKCLSLDCEIQDPKEKFKRLKIPMDTQKKNHKKAIVAYVSGWLVDNTDLSEHLASFTKKDDLCDAIAMNLVSAS
jgi:hypothetical protein